MTVLEIADDDLVLTAADRKTKVFALGTILVPEDIRGLVESYKLARPSSVADDQLQCLDPKADERVAKHSVCRIVRMMLTMLVVIGVPLVYISFLQQVLPDYSWDVHGPCQSHISALASET